MDNVRLIDGKFSQGERLVFEDFMDLPKGSIVWGKAKGYNGPLQMDAVDGEFRSLTDGDKIGIGIEFPNVAPDSPVACFAGTDIGQMEFFEAVPQFDGK